MAAKDWERLAELTRERRVELGLTQEDARAAGGPSTATMRLIEGALQQTYQPATLRDLEKVLQWGHGSVRAILAGGDPVPLRPAAGDRILAALDADDGPAFSDVPPELQPAVSAHRAAIAARLEVAQSMRPGEPLTGEAVFPRTVPDRHARDRAAWDFLLSQGWPAEGIADGLARLMAAADQEAATGSGGLRAVELRS